jgi:hypothetical protein
VSFNYLVINNKKKKQNNNNNIIVFLSDHHSEMTVLNKFKKFMTNLKDAAGKKLKDIFGIVKTFPSNPGNTIKTGINVVKTVKDLKDGKQVNFQNLLKVGKDNILPLVNQALRDEVKTIQGTLNPLIQLKDQLYN